MLNALAINEKKQKITIWCLITIVLFSTLVMLTPITHALQAGEGWCNSVKEKANLITGGAVQEVVLMITGDNPDPIVELATKTINVNTTTNVAKFMSPYIGFYNVLKIMGATIILALALSRVFTNIDKGTDPMEAVFKVLIEIAIAGIFCMYIDKIFSILTQLGLELCKLLGDGGITSTEILSQNGVVEFPVESWDLVAKLSSDDFADKIDDGSAELFETIAITMDLLFPWVAMLIMKIVAKFAVYQVAIEIMIRRFFAPIAVVDVYQEGIRSPGARYIKKYFATVLKLLMIVFICILTNDLGQNLLEDKENMTAWTYMSSLILVNLTGISLFFKTAEYTNDIVGA